MYQKISIDCSDIDLDHIKGPLMNAYGQTFKVYSLVNTDYLWDKINSKVHFNILPFRINLTEIHSPGVEPHTDAWPTALNLYLTANSGNDLSVFFKRKNDNHIQVGGVKKFLEEDCEAIDQFIANKGESYLLNTFVPHGVKMANNNDARSILRFVWDRPFQKVLDSLDIKQK